MNIRMNANCHLKVYAFKRHYGRVNLQPITGYEELKWKARAM